MSKNTFVHATFPFGSYEFKVLCKTKTQALKKLREKWDEIAKTQDWIDPDYFNENLDGISYNEMELDSAQFG